MIPGTGQRIDAFRMALIGFVVLCLCRFLKSFFAFDETISDKDWEHEDWLF